MSNVQRELHWDYATAATFDVVIIGGGVNGALEGISMLDQ